MRKDQEIKERGAKSSKDWVSCDTIRCNLIITNLFEANPYHSLAYKVTCIMDLSHRFGFVSDAVPYAHHDIYRLKQCWPNIEDNITKKDCLALDTGYLSFDRLDRGCQFHIKKRAAVNHPLSKEDDLFNIKVEESRQFIELGFDKVKSVFRICKHKYHGDRKDLNDYVRFCFALHNEIAEYEYSPRNYSNEWTGPVVRLEFEKTGNKGVSFCRIFGFCRLILRSKFK